MHIAFWSPAWPLEKHQNGIVTYVHWMKRELERQGHRVSVFTSVLDAAVNDPHVHLVRHGPWARAIRRLARPLFPIERDIYRWGRVVAAAILELHRREPVDIIEMEESFGWNVDVGRITSIPLLIKLHGPAYLTLTDEELRTPTGRERVAREGRALAAAVAIASPTQITLDKTLERYQLAPSICQHIVNPLTLEEGTPVWRLDGCDRDTVLFIGRFDRIKGADIALQAFELLLRVRPNLKFVFVGPDSGLLQPDGTNVHFEAFRDALLPLASRNRVDFRGRMANHEVAQLRVQAMVTVIASRWETQGYTVLEAMLQGCPVVCSNAGGCPESVTHGATGLLARSEDVEDFTAQLAKILDDPQRAAAMGDAARRYVINRHSLGGVALDALALYERVISIDHR